jgi:membrane protein YdbS with pleckstrin-like domain
MRDIAAPPHNPLRLPFFLLCAAIAIVVAAVGIAYSAWWLVALGVVLFVASVALIRVIRQGRNPRWLQAPLDRRWPRQ